MKGIRFIELLSEIKANLVAFLSIAMFVCLGVGLLNGIDWGRVALVNTVEQAFDEGKLQDVEVMFPYGITDDDLEQVRAVGGVDQVEAGYTAFVRMISSNKKYVLKLRSMTEEMNLPTSVKGTLPTKANEIAVLENWAEKEGMSLGDTITLEHDANAQDDADGMEYLTSDTYTITALVSHPLYLQKSTDSLGVSSIGSGRIDGIGFVRTEAFDASKFHDGYTNVYIRSDALRGLATLSDAYKETAQPLIDELTELGAKLGDARYDELHGEAQGKIDEAQQKVSEGEEKLAEGEEKLAEGEQQIAEGEQKLADGEEELVSGKETMASEQVMGAEQLAEAYQKLVEGQAQYDAGLQQYNTASNTYNELAAKFDEVRPTYDAFIGLYNELPSLQEGLDTSLSDYDAAVADYEAASEEDKDDAWADVANAYAALASDHQEAATTLSELSGNVGAVSSALGIPVSVGGLSTLDALSVDEAELVSQAGHAASSEISSAISRIDAASMSVNGMTVSLTDIPGGFSQAYEQLESTRQTLDDANAQLEDGWAQYNANKELYDQKVAEGKEKIDSGEKELEEGKATLEEKKNEFEEGKATLEEKKSELEEGKATLADAEDKLAQMVKYEWVVSPRQELGGVRGVDMIQKTMANVRWAMASLFVLVGLLVCYSAVSRLVHEHIVQIGTKKALGFRTGEITLMYLAFSGLAVLLGVALSVLLAVFVIQAIMNPKASMQFVIPQYDPLVEPLDILIFGGLEFVLILLATNFATRGILKRNAIDLLRGESTASVKERFYERTRLWQRMSLYSQTIVNNCVNDRRRVVGTLVGVIGCTALIVTAVTLQSNVSRSLQRHYDEVYDFESIAYLDGSSDENARNMAMALYDRGVPSAPAYRRQLQVRGKDGLRSLVTIMVPTSEKAFEKLYHVRSNGEEVTLGDDGIWVSSAFANHRNIQVGDEVTLTEATGKTHTFEVAGILEFYLLRQEFVMSKSAYGKVFGGEPEANVLLVDSEDMDLDELRDELSDVKGFESLSDDKTNSSYLYGELESILKTVVLIYLGLSAAMAIMVLLNLDTMFVDEKKRELIVLMICGFSAKEAKAYIYRDSIVLTIIGILLGIALGSAAGSYTVLSLEPETGFFVKDFNEIAALVGAVGAGVFAIAVLLYALRRIPRFDLTDINRF